MEPLLTSLLDGYNVCILAYGQTGSGKTFTMVRAPSCWNRDSQWRLTDSIIVGTNQQGEPDEGNPGLIMRAMAHLFGLMESRRDLYEFETKITVIEIYNNSVRDLLAKKTTSEDRK